MSCKDGLLTPNQLTDLLNYMLKLPTRTGKQIIRCAIPVMVVKVWSKRKERNAAERWCDCELMKAGVLQRPKCGRWHPELPKCLQGWADALAIARSATAGR